MARRCGYLKLLTRSPQFARLRRYVGTFVGEGYSGHQIGERVKLVKCMSGKAQRGHIVWSYLVGQTIFLKTLRLLFHIVRNGTNGNIK